MKDPKRKSSVDSIQSPEVEKRWRKRNHKYEVTEQILGFLERADNTVIIIYASLLGLAILSGWLFLIFS